MAVLVSDQWCTVNLLKGDQNLCKVMGSLNCMYGELFKQIIDKARYKLHIQDLIFHDGQIKLTQILILTRCCGRVYLGVSVLGMCEGFYVY